MTMFESQLRDALTRAGSEVPATSVPPLRLPDGATGFSPGGGRREDARPAARPARWLAPAASAATVLVIAAAAAFAIGVRHDQSAASGQGVSQVPRYYIAVTPAAKPGRDHKTVAGIYSTATGALIASIVPSGKEYAVLAVSASANDRTFAIAVTDLNSGLARFSLVNFSPATRGVKITPIGPILVPSRTVFRGFALSPDGTRLAVMESLPAATHAAVTGELVIENLATRTIRTWTSRQGLMPGSLDPAALSWAADDVTLAFDWYGFSYSQPGHSTKSSGLRILDTARPGSAIVADSRLVIPFHAGISGVVTTRAGYPADIATLAPGGMTVVAAITARPAGIGGDGWFGEYNASDGRLERELDRKPMGDDTGKSKGWPMDVIWTSPAGGTLVVNAPPGHPGQVGVWRAGHLTVLPHDPKIIFPDAAW
jgi:hypothetical protein